MSAMTPQEIVSELDRHIVGQNPAKRAVVLNGRELHEGSEIAPGVLLVAIAQDYIILQVGGQHVSLKALQDWRG